MEQAREEKKRRGSGEAQRRKGGTRPIGIATIAITTPITVGYGILLLNTLAHPISEN